MGRRRITLSQQFLRLFFNLPGKIIGADYDPFRDILEFAVEVPDLPEPMELEYAPESPIMLEPNHQGLLQILSAKAAEVERANAARAAAEEAEKPEATFEEAELPSEPAKPKKRGR